MQPRLETMKFQKCLQPLYTTEGYRCKRILFLHVHPCEDKQAYRVASFDIKYRRYSRCFADEVLANTALSCVLGEQP